MAERFGGWKRMNVEIPKITSSQNSLVKHLVKLRQNRSYRYDHHTVIVEGIKLINEIAEHQNPRVVLTYDVSFVPKNWKNANIIEVSEQVMQKVSGMVQPEGLLAEIEMPHSKPLTNLNYIVAFDGVSDPGNMGNLMRTALALGWEGVFLLDDCCDPYNEKVIRAGRGANFKLPICEGSWDDLKELIDKNPLTPFVADLEGMPPTNLPSLNKVLLVLGNEAHGPSEQAVKVCQKISIPISSKMESLNVASAGAILMYVIRSQ
jgi:TrmH family RNA methyltransferase